ncbi:MAG TPA: bifunctional oligoribonuclease/PAP phosphatase NrnA [Candidatus Absconditabacterales bacterium]|nr:bifunctional oligoribonuclease/PAP phosphatase NrnA [Candidatus Absconditabacterales bacterium]
MKEVIKKIEAAQKIAIFCHVNPDGDAIGSMLGLGKILEKKGKDIFYFSPNKPSKIYDFLGDTKKITDNFDYGYYNLLIFVDLSDYSRLGKFIKGKENYFKENEIVVFDHHEGNKKQENWLTIRDTKSTSTCELIFEKTIDIREKYYDEKIATYLYLGLTTDSGNFRYDENHERILKNALELIKLGANKKLIIDNFINNKSIGTINFLKVLLERISQKGDVLYTYYDIDELHKYDIDQEQAGYGLTIIQEIKGPKIIANIRKDGNKIKGSLRSKDTNVEKIAKIFNGGGHMYAAGFSIPIEKDFKTTIKKTIDKINDLI